MIPSRAEKASSRAGQVWLQRAWRGDGEFFFLVLETMAPSYLHRVLVLHAHGGNWRRDIKDGACTTVSEGSISWEADSLLERLS